MAGSSPTPTGRECSPSNDTSVDSAAAESGACTVGVLSPHNSKETKAILNAVTALGHEPVWIRDENVSSLIEDGEVAISPSVDILVNRLLLTKSDDALEDLELAGLYETTGPVLNPPAAVQRTLHKYRAGAVLADAGLPVPDAFFSRAPRTFEAWSDHLDGEAAHKPTIGTNGHLMSVVDDATAASPKIDGGRAFVQELLDTDGHRPSDVRVYVVGTDIVGAMRRRAPAGEWRTNVARGGSVEDITDDLGATPRRIAREATAVLGLDIAGVDLMKADGSWYVLEVNATAGFRGLYQATGISPAPYIAGLALERLGHPAEDSRVAELASSLADSVPSCKPDPDADEGDPATLGYTTRVALSGADGLESVLAKSDTGAERTSIDTTLAGDIGAGPLVGTTQVRSAASRGLDTRPLVDIALRIGGVWRTVTASLTDRSELQYPVLLGRDVLESYTLDVSRTVEE